MSTITSKQDAGYVRTAQDLERKHQFGKTFGDMLGLINDNRDKVDSVESSLRDEIMEQSTTIARDTEKIIMEAKEDLAKKVGIELDADEVSIVVDRVETKSGYTFDTDGLNISKSGEPISNELTHKGMYVTNSGENILVADKDGVQATDLHAKTYLIVGKADGRSRFEDYLVDRTACFWIGG